MAPASDRMAAPLPHRASPLQRTLAVSLALHLAIVLAVRIAAPPIREEAAFLPAPVSLDVELEAPAGEAESDRQVAADVTEGREDLAQGALEPATTAPAPPPAEPPSPPAAPAEPAPPAPTTAPPIMVERDDDGAVPPPATTARPARRPAPARPPASSSSAVAITSSSPAASAAAPPGDGGGFARATARDLAASFTSAIPPSCDAMMAWRTLPPGNAGQTEVLLRSDDEGHLLADVVFDPPSATPPHFAELVARARLRMGRAPAALDAAGVGAGTLRLRLSIHIEEVPVPRDVPGGSFGLHASFREGRGEATFTLQEGRRVTITVTALRVERAPR